MKTERLTRLLVLHPLLFAAMLLSGLGPVSGQSVFHTVKYFGFAEFSVIFPTGGFVEGTNGVFYGMGAFGGENGNGTVFRLNQDGTGLLVLKAFKVG